MNKSFKLGLLVFFLGFLGVLTLLFTDFPLDDLPIPEIAKQKISEIPSVVLKLLMLINPTLLLIVSVVFGTLFYKNTGLRLPLIKSLATGEKSTLKSADIKIAALYGMLAGLVMMVLMFLIKDYLPEDYLKIGEKFQPNILTRFLYGGITEEILMRFGLMTFLVWLISIFTNHLKPIVYWLAITLAAIVFGFGHFPAVYSFIESPTTTLLIFILVANTIGGLVFGWLYWKKGLEMAMVGHIFAHVAMLIIEQFV